MIHRIREDPRGDGSQRATDQQGGLCQQVKTTGTSMSRDHKQNHSVNSETLLLDGPSPLNLKGFYLSKKLN